MVKEGHELFRRWAKWERLSVGGVDLGYGRTVLDRVREGKGTILPGAPPGSGPKKIDIDEVCMKIGRFIARMRSGEKTLIKVYYLDEIYSVEEKLKMLKLEKRELYRQLHKLQLKLVCHMEEMR